MAVLIGDFQLGSDSAVILDYSQFLQEPPVKWLKWMKPRNEWITACRSFDELADRLRLDFIVLPPN